MIPIYVVAILGLLAYYVYQLFIFKGTIKEFFAEKKNLLHWLFSAITMVILIIAVDWSSIEKSMTFAEISFKYVYVVAAIVGWFNGSIFMALMKAAGKKKPQ